MGQHLCCNQHQIHCITDSENCRVELCCQVHCFQNLPLLKSRGALCVHEHGMLVPGYGIYCTEECFLENKCWRSDCGQAKRSFSSFLKYCIHHGCKQSCKNHDLLHTLDCKERTSINKLKHLVRTTFYETSQISEEIVAAFRRNTCSVCKTTGTKTSLYKWCHQCHYPICFDCQTYWSVWSHSKRGISDFLHVGCWQNVVSRKKSVENSKRHVESIF